MRILFLSIVILLPFMAMADKAISQMPLIPLSVLKMKKSDVKPYNYYVTRKSPNAGRPLRIPKPTFQKVSWTNKQGIKNSKLTVTVEPGINRIVPVGMGHVNRIVVPFAELDFATGANLPENAIVPKRNVLYVTPPSDSPYPISLYITPKGREEPAISITLAPERKAPTEVVVKFADGISLQETYDVTPGSEVTEEARPEQKANPYVTRVKNLLRDMALQKTPRGFSLGRIERSDWTPTCHQAGLAFQFRNGQFLKGRDFYIYVGLIENQSSSLKLVKEHRCLDKEIAAVAVWPKIALEPDERAEIYVVVRRNKAERKRRRKERPSLL